MALLFSTFSFAQTQPVNATIDVSKTGAPISKYVYGQFLEHIGGLVNNSIWAEMLDDRKFYYRSRRTRLPNQPDRLGGAPRCAIGHQSAATNSWPWIPIAPMLANTRPW